MQTGPRVLVTDAQDIPALAGIRCLAASGHTVAAAAPATPAIGLLSRRCAEPVHLPDAAEGTQPFVDALARWLELHPTAAVIAVRDGTLLALSAHRSALGDAVATGVPGPESLQRAFDRVELARAAGEAGLPAPEQRLCSTPDAAVAAAGELGWPVLIKPLVVCAEHEGRVRRHASHPAGDAEAVRALAIELGPCLVQRWVGGSVVSVGGVADADGMFGVVVSRYLRTWPREAGQSSLIATIEPPPGLIERAEAVVGDLGWTGIFELELIEEADGALRAIDFNPRVYGSLALARAAGVPLTSLWCDRLLSGRRAGLVVARAGVHFREDSRELYNLADRLRRRRYAEAAQILRPRRGTAHAAVSLRDPLPGALAMTYAARGVLRSRGKA